MIISTRRRYIFVHIPKTGGTSLALALEARAAADDILIGDTPKAQRRRGRLKGLQAAGRLWKHSTLADIDGILPPDQMAQMKVICMVRNPWDRLVSYYHWLQEQTFDHEAVRLAQALSFSGFLNHPHTQASFLQWPFERHVTLANGAKRGDFFVRLEDFQRDIAAFEAHLGFAIELPKVNVSRRRRDYRSYYSEADSELVARLCAEDIARFGYAF
ncbi:sulfotransferase family 2 domain-containing protein [Roseovarius nubinhibens]|uniref:sulfotransferase family 2 domain-containing protein n=1 Tax=Roseovarius nubinhibens TaxID=314263 RepID=UPI001C083C27|nr:sulfotransferase family 2 domain-containing protein [Roseovarius nubinhibens]MBU2999466.1 sulfotransferase family 2 domain-containing protein [Roseovarius nubinhibens]